MINWHRLFGQALIDLFTDTTYVVELEKDLSLKQQFLDIVIIKKTGKTLAMELPDGFDNLGDYSLITYKSLREPLNAWTLKELIGHYVNYRKQISNGNKLLPENMFRLYAVATRFPSNLKNKIKLKSIQRGVYDLQWATDTIRLIVLSKISETTNNALWCLFSGVNEKVSWGTINYRFKSKVSTILNDLYKNYQLEGINMTYTRADYELEMKQRFLTSLTPEERLRGLSPNEVLRQFPVDKLLHSLDKQELTRPKVALELTTAF